VALSSTEYEVFAAPDGDGHLALDDRQETAMMMTTTTKIEGVNSMEVLSFPDESSL
jgi:hypothetical protein